MHSSVIIHPLVHVMLALFLGVGKDRELGYSDVNTNEVFFLLFYLYSGGKTIHQVSPENHNHGETCDSYNR